MFPTTLDRKYSYMTTRNDNTDLKKKVQIICLYFSKLHSDDKRRRKIISKYRELEMLTGIKANTDNGLIHLILILIMVEKDSIKGI